jgi:hypothetical protein
MGRRSSLAKKGEVEMNVYSLSKTHKSGFIVLLIALSMIIAGMGFSSASAIEITLNPVIDTSDWVTLEGDGVSLLVPPEFEGGSVEELLELIEIADDVLPEEFGPFIELVEQNPGVYEFFAYAPTLVEGGVLTNINITGSPLPMRLPMSSILEMLPASFPQSIEIVESTVMTLGNYDEVGVLWTSMEVLGIEQRLTMYIYQIDGQLYAITFTTSADAFEELAPIFREIASSFEVTLP